MARTARLVVLEAERRFPVRIKIGVPPNGFGRQLTEIHRWLDEHAGLDGWAIAPAARRGVVNDAVAVYFLDTTLAGAFVARWCVAQRVEITEGVFRVRQDSPTVRVPAKAHKTPP